MKFLVGALLLAAALAVTCSETGSDESTNEDLSALGCLLAGAEPNCGFPSVLPHRLIELYHGLSTQTKYSILTGDFASLPPDDVTQLPATLVYLLPPRTMLTLSGSNLGLLLQKHRKDVAMAVKIAQAVSRKAGDGHRLHFLDTLMGTELPVQTQSLLGNKMLSWWPNITTAGDIEDIHAVFLIGIRTGSPLLAYLPASTIREFHGKIAEKFLFNIRNWDKSSLRPWSDNSQVVRRVWAELVFREIYGRWRPEEVKGFEFLISGATPSEILNLTKNQLYEKVNVFGISAYDTLQARALFSAVCNDAVLKSANLSELLPIVRQLSPRDVQHFAVNATDFRMIKSTSPDQRPSSFAADKQIGEMLIAQAVIEKRLSSTDSVSSWDNIKERGQFAYTLPPRDLKLQNNASARDWSLFLKSIDSNKLSRKQAWLVTIHGTLLNPRNSSSVLGLHGLLKGIPTSQFVNYETGKLPHDVLDYLAATLPNYEPVMSAVLLHKLRPQLDEGVTLENFLSNDDPNQFFNLLSSREIIMRKNEMFTSLNSLWNLWQSKIESLPQHFLSILLKSTRIRTSGPWKADELIQHVAFMGLSCNVIDEIDPIDAIDILSHYNGKLHTSRKSFPKDLQYCAQKLVYRYLQEKSDVRQDTSRENVLGIMEPAEIQAIGGYILASIPPPLIERALYHRKILQTIGQQPLPYLWEATGSKSYLDRYARLALESLVDMHSNFQLKTYELLSLGSFVHFLTKDTIEHIASADFKFYLESLEDNRAKTLCCSLEDRKAWYELIKLAFGSPSSWTVTTLSTLGDWLVAVPYEALDRVPSKRWTAAVDDLAEKTSYHLELRWPGRVEPVMFAKVCSEVLNQQERDSYDNTVNSLLNRYLIASQSQLDTVVSARQLVVSSQDSNQVVTVKGVKVPKPAVEVEVIQTVEVDVDMSIETPDENVAKPPQATTQAVVATTPVPLNGILEQTTVTQLIQGVPSTTDVVPISADITSTTEDMQTAANMSSSTGDITIPDEMPTSTENMPIPPDMPAGTLLTQTKSGTEESKTMQSTSVPLPLISRDVKGKSKRSPLRPGDGALSKAKAASKTSKTLKEKRKTSADERRIISQAQKNENDNRTRRKITCDAVRALGPSASLALQMYDIDQMSRDELVNCLETLGELQLPHYMYRLIWRRVKSENKTVLISDLAYLGHLVQAIETEDVDQLNLSLSSPNSLDVLSVLGREVPYGVWEQLAERFHLDNKGVSNIGPAPLIAMGRIICDIPLNTVRKLMGTSFLHVATSLGQAISVHNVSECQSCVDHLVRLAMEDNAFGPPDTWSAEDISNLGAISAGLLGQKWQMVNASAMYGLPPSAVKCIDPPVFKEFSVEQLLHLSPLTAAIVSTEQLAELSDEQKSALEQVRDLQPMFTTQSRREPDSDGTRSGATAVGMNACAKDRQLFLKYLRNEMFVLVYMFIFSVMIINAY